MRTAVARVPQDHPLSSSVAKLSSLHLLLWNGAVIQNLGYLLSQATERAELRVTFQ